MPLQPRSETAPNSHLRDDVLVLVTDVEIAQAIIADATNAIANPV